MRSWATLLLLSLSAISLGVGGCLHTQKKTSMQPPQIQDRESELGDAKVVPVEEVPQDSSVALSDPQFSEKWGLIAADASRAWALSKGSRSIVVAVIDTGVDLKHEDLVGNLWTNPGESGLDSRGRDKRKNGVDDDNNGFVDDVHGWNFITGTPDLTDNHGHGTHISGIIGARADNGVGISGVAPEVQLMTLKYYDPKVPGADNLGNTIKAIRYAVQMGADIINYSGGGLEFSQAEFDAVQLAQSKGILFVAAAGNERSNSDVHRYYPADYDLDNIISVTAIDPKKKVLSSSNYGVKTVHLAAPGQNILSTLPGSTYGFMTGTSQATGFVTGAAVVVKARHPSFNYRDIKRFILNTGDNEEALAQKTQTSRRLNLFRALTIQDASQTASGLIRNRAEIVSPEPSATSLGFDGEFKSALRDLGKSLSRLPDSEEDPKNQKNSLRKNPN